VEDEDEAVAEVMMLVVDVDDRGLEIGVADETTMGRSEVLLIGYDWAELMVEKDVKVVGVLALEEAFDEKDDWF
jgi:hypothetical protein